MKAIDCIEKLITTSLPLEKLRFCFVDENKRPFKPNGEMARPNKIEDFFDLPELTESDKIMDYIGIGISIQASNIFAIDVDHCFTIDENEVIKDERAKNILEMFSDKAYCEYSFSGTGLRILFDSEMIDDFSKYYIKNEKNQIEFYQPSTSFRYVTLTGNTISDNFSKIDSDTISAFLEKYMKRPVRAQRKIYNVEDAPMELLQKRLKILYLKNHDFQDLWFGKAPGSGKDESERDFHILAYLYENVTQNKDKVKLLFEMSPYFKSKDWKHMKKWEQQDFRYFNYVFEQIERRN